MALYDTFRRLLASETPLVVATVIAGERDIGARAILLADGTVHGSVAIFDRIPAARNDALRLLAEERSATERYRDIEVFYDAYPAPPQLVIVGAAGAAGPLSSYARSAGYRVTICDARAAFAQPERFPEADSVLKGWPQDILPDLELGSSTYLVLLSHDARFDMPTLRLALPSSVRYIGAIGSSRTQGDRRERLRAEGFTEEQLARIHGPVGLDIGARTPEETALAILAEMTAVRRGASGGFLRDRKRKG